MPLIKIHTTPRGAVCEKLTFDNAGRYIIVGECVNAAADVVKLAVEKGLATKVSMRDIAEQSLIEIKSDYVVGAKSLSEKDKKYVDNRETVTHETANNEQV